MKREVPGRARGSGGVRENFSRRRLSLTLFLVRVPFKNISYKKVEVSHQPCRDSHSATCDEVDLSVETGVKYRHGALCRVP